MEYVIENGSVIIDVEEEERLNEEKWSINAWGYAANSNPMRIRSMSRFILNYDGPLEVDHINGNKLDNRKCNLRIVPHYVNLLNGRKHVDSSNNYKGVHFNGEWGYYIMIDGERFSRYGFKNEEEALVARETFKNYALSQKSKGEPIERPRRIGRKYK